MSLIQNIRAMSRGSTYQKVLLLVCLMIIVFSLFRFVTKGIVPALQETGYDYYHHYAAGQLWNENLNPYDYATFRARLYAVGQERATTFETRYFYPPYTVFIVSSLSHLSFDAAYVVQLVISIVSIIAGIALLGLVLSWFRPIGLYEITFLAALFNTVASRDSLRAAQTSPLIFVFMTLLLIATRKRQDSVAGFSLFMAANKPTSVPLFAIYLLIRRRSKVFLIFVFILALFTSVPLILTHRSIIEYVLDWTKTLSTASSDVNDPSPFNFISGWLVNFQVLVYRVLNAESTVTTLASWGIILGLCALSFYLMRITRESKSDETLLLDFALLSTLSLGMIYHRQYDMFLMFPGLVYLYIVIARMTDGYVKTAWAVFLLLILAVLTVPGDFLIGVIAANPQLHDSYLMRVILPIQGWSNVVLTGVLFWLKYIQVRQHRSVAVPTLADPVPAD